VADPLGVRGPHVSDAASIVPIDISADHLNGSVERLRVEYPHVDVHPVVGDYTMRFENYRRRSPPDESCQISPGSTIGNFDPDEALASCNSHRARCAAADC